VNITIYIRDEDRALFEALKARGLNCGALFSRALRTQVGRCLRCGKLPPDTCGGAQHGNRGCYLNNGSTIGLDPRRGLR
jgi:hypothetical protein